MTGIRRDDHLGGRRSHVEGRHSPSEQHTVSRPYGVAVRARFRTTRFFPFRGRIRTLPMALSEVSAQGRSDLRTVRTDQASVLYQGAAIHYYLQPGACCDFGAFCAYNVELGPEHLCTDSCS